MKRVLFLFTSLLMAVCFISCENSTGNKNKTTTENDSLVTTSMPAPLREKVLTAEEQQALLPDTVIQRLKEGNQRFVNNNITARDHSAMVRNASVGQYPKAVILSCLDSRVPVEDVFDKGIGDLFVARVAGNFVNEDILGSMEYGCKVSGAKLILVLGHESCGAIKAAIDGVKLGNITAMLAKVKPSVVKSGDFAGEKSSKNNAFVEYVAKNNVLNTIETIKAKSPILKEMMDKGEIKIVGAYYNLKTGEVIFLLEKTGASVGAGIVCLLAHASLPVAIGYLIYTVRESKKSEKSNGAAQAGRPGPKSKTGMSWLFFNWFYLYSIIFLEFKTTIMIVAYVSFNGNTEEVFNFYKSALGGKIVNIQRFGDSPHGDQMSDEDKKKVMHIALEAPGDIKLMGNDHLDLMGGPYNAGNNFSLSFHPGSKAEADKLFNSLSAGGTVTVPMSEAPWGDYFGMFNDKFGIKWMINHQKK